MSTGKVENISRIKYDGKLEIAIAKNRKDTRLKNTEISWLGLVRVLNVPRITAETCEEYFSFKKDRQDEIKDVGGFVGGNLLNGQRKTTNVLYRQVLTLDIDHAQDFGVWENYKLIYGNAAAVYSTHKHRPKSPRLRLVIPLARPVNREEYEAVGRKIAESLGIENFDNSTFEPARLMYYSSTSKDGARFFEILDGEWMSPDSILSEYEDWKDISKWARNKKSQNELSNGAAIQEDPTAKKGVVGAFCRSYTIHDAIEKYLAGIYEPCDINPGRYTYSKGSAYGGVVVYDDKFAYSHHESDPAGGRLLNAFDLVRVHKYGDADENIKNQTRSDRLPSYILMEEMATKDGAVKKLISKERLESAGMDFTDGENPDWIDNLDLEVDKKGNYLSTPENVEKIFANDPRLKGLFANDLFSKKRVVTRLPFWRENNDSMLFCDNDLEQLHIYFSKEPYRINARRFVEGVFSQECEHNAFHPVKDWLDTLEWDGTERVERLFIDSLGAEDSEYVRRITKTMLTAAIKRIYEPGCDMDYTIVLIGKEGIGKSKMLKTLAKNPTWFTDNFGVEGKEAYENLRGKWIIEIAELAALKKAEAEAIKRFISAPKDYYRAAYAHNAEDYPRQCVFFGSTNDRYFLKGIGGDRRFWPVDTDPAKKVKDWSEYTDEEIDQIWAEAKACYLQGDKLFLPPHLEKEAKERQKEHIELDSWESEIDAWLDEPVAENWWDSAGVDFMDESEKTAKRYSVTIAEIWKDCIKGKYAVDYASQRRIVNIMSRKSGWEYKRHRRGEDRKQYRGWINENYR